MASQPTFLLLIDNHMPAESREELLETLSDQHVRLRETASRDPLSAWLTFLAVLSTAAAIGKSVKEIADAAEAVGKAIVTWRDVLHKQGREPRAILQAPGLADLDLATATDAEVLTWLLNAAN